MNEVKNNFDIDENYIQSIIRSLYIITLIIKYYDIGKLNESIYEQEILVKESK